VSTWYNRLQLALLCQPERMMSNTSRCEHINRCLRPTVGLNPIGSIWNNEKQMMEIPESTVVTFFENKTNLNSARCLYASGVKARLHNATQIGCLRFLRPECTYLLDRYSSSPPSDTPPPSYPLIVLLFVDLYTKWRIYIVSITQCDMANDVERCFEVLTVQGTACFSARLSIIYKMCACQTCILISVHQLMNTLLEHFLLQAKVMIHPALELLGCPTCRPAAADAE
jgi:hypothetical protein